MTRRTRDRGTRDLTSEMPVDGPSSTPQRAETVLVPPQSAPESPSQSPTQSPTLVEESEEEVVVPMLEEPTHLPGSPRRSFSPLAFFALSRVDRSDVDVEDVDLWLHEEKCPQISDSGLALHGQKFEHPDLQMLVDGLPGLARNAMVVRYDRALLARGVLQEVTVCVLDASGRVSTRIHCRPRGAPASGVDLNRALRERERIKRVTRAKTSAGQWELISFQHGDAAMEKFQRDQAARLRRQRRQHPAPIVAAPIIGLTRAEAEHGAAAARTAALAEHIGQSPSEEEERAEAGSITEGGEAAVATRKRGTAPGQARKSPRRSGRETRNDPAVAGSIGSDDGEGMVADRDAPKGSTDQQQSKAERGRGRGPSSRKPARSPRATRSSTEEVEPAIGTRETPSPLPDMALLIQELGGQSGFLTTDND